MLGSHARGAASGDVCTRVLGFVVGRTSLIGFILVGCANGGSQADRRSNHGGSQFVVRSVVCRFVVGARRDHGRVLVVGFVVGSICL